MIFTFFSGSLLCFLNKKKESQCVKATSVKRLERIYWFITIFYFLCQLNYGQMYMGLGIAEARNTLKMSSMHESISITMPVTKWDKNVRSSITQENEENVVIDDRQGRSYLQTDPDKHKEKSYKRKIN